MNKAKELRLRVYKKYDGHCAYCGNDILLKAFQIDHAYPKARAIPTDKILVDGWLNTIQVNDFSNLMPVCRRCNHYKRSEDIEGFRKYMLMLHDRISKMYINKVGFDYGILSVELKPFDGIFYFEKQKGI